MKPSQILSDEHKNILFMLDILKKQNISLQNGNKPSPDDLTKIVNFLRYYADKYHHAKEEDILFPKYESVGVPAQGPIGVMLDEHVIGRQHIEGMLKAIEEMKAGHNSQNSFIIHANQYSSLLQGHIFKEDNILYPMGDEKMNRNDEFEVSQKFDSFEQKRFEYIPQLKDVLETLNQYKQE